jgi:hypothetical protein
VVTVKLREWLEGCGCYDIREVEVKIGRATYEGCRAKQRREPRSAIPNAAQDEREFVYLLGDLPAAYQRSRRTAFTVEGESCEWYVVMWVTPETASHSTYGQYHYEGNGAFMLQPWTLDEKIDKFEAAPYQRVKATVREKVTA